MKAKTNFIIEFNSTGICNVDVDLLVKKWNHLYSISQWHDEYRLIKLKQKNSPITQIKVTISDIQFIELKRKLKLYQIKSTLFRHGSTWKIINTLV